MTAWRWRNSNTGYGLIAIAAHWLTVAAILVLYPLVLYIVSLTYYDSMPAKPPGVATGLVSAVKPNSSSRTLALTTTSARLPRRSIWHWKSKASVSNRPRDSRPTEDPERSAHRFGVF